METKYFLHDLARHTNLQMPLPKYVDKNRFPDQAWDKVGAKVTLDYIDERFVPSTFNYDSHDAPYEFADRKFTKTFTIARYDDPDLYIPATAIYISEAGEVIVVMHDKMQTDYDFKAQTADGTEKDVELITDKDTMDIDLLKYLSQIPRPDDYKGPVYLETPNEYDHLIGMKVYPEYSGKQLGEAYIFAIQALEPGYTVVIEHLGTNKYRLILDTELFFEYNPDDIYVPEKAPNIYKKRLELIEGRTPFNG